MPGFVISSWTKRRTVDSTLYSTTSMLRTMELILGLQPMSQFDAAAMPMWACFGDRSDPTPYTARPAQVNVNELNAKLAWGERESRKMDFSEPDKADDIQLNEIIWRTELNELPIEITSVIGNREACRSITERSGIPFHHIEMDGERREKGFLEIRDLLLAENVELIVLARFMQILPDTFCQEFSGKIINIHHSFLPAFIGANPYKQAHERGVKLIGATCHYVTADLDAGPIIEQEVERVSHFHSPTDLSRLGRQCERIALAKGIRYHVHDRTLIDGHRAIVFPD
jgi:formyltetrahydrofolate deformylase